MAVFSGIVHFAGLAAGHFSCFLLRGPQGGGVDSRVQALAPAGLRYPCSIWSKSRDPASNRDPTSGKVSRGLKTYPDLRISSCKDIVFLAFCCKSNNNTHLLEFVLLELMLE